MMELPIERISEYKIRIPKTYKAGMLVDGIVYADDNLLKEIKKDRAIGQVVNVAFLPGIVGYSLAMPDIHWGYGFPIGGVAATDPLSGGVISPGGVGYDINCGVRLIKTNLTLYEVKGKLDQLINRIFQEIPSGVGSKGKVRVTIKEVENILYKGAGWAVSKGFGIKQDLINCEDEGALEGADPEYVSQRAFKRGMPQAGTLGSGNHFIEVQFIDQIFDPKLSEKFGIYKSQIVVMIHSGSRGLGYQVCDDSLHLMHRTVDKYNIKLLDRQLACVPIQSPEGGQYLSAMRAAANYAWCNRQVLMHLVREVFEKVFTKSWQNLNMDLIYDVAHNIAKFEKYNIENNEKTLCVHRKGATRAFGPGNLQLPEHYQDTGQPVIIPGDMGSASYLLVGTQKCEETFFSTCHGAGRVKSRHEALKTVDFDTLIKELSKKGIEVRSTGKKTIVEEAPCAYKDINRVVDVVEGSGLNKKVCRMRPLCVLKG